MCRFLAIFLSICIHIAIYFILIKDNSNKSLKAINNIVINNIVIKKSNERKIFNKINKIKGILQKEKLKTNAKAAPMKLLNDASQDLKNFMPNEHQFEQWRKEGVESNNEHNAFLDNSPSFEKNYSSLVSAEELIKEQLQLPVPLRKVFKSAEVKIKIIKTDNKNFRMYSIYGKNQYFRAFIYNTVVNLLSNQYFISLLDKSNQDNIYFTFNYEKIVSAEDPGIEKKYQVSKDTISILFAEKVKPDEYNLIAGGLNIMGIASYAYDKAFPDEYQNDPELKALRSSLAFFQEGVLR